MRCKHTKPDGTRCKAEALKDGEYCFRHSPDPDTKQKALESSSLGGLNRRNYQKYGEEVTLDTTSDIKGLISQCINKIWTGEMSSQNPAGSIGYLARVLLEIQRADEGVMGTKQDETQRRIQALMEEQRRQYEM